MIFTSSAIRSKPSVFCWLLGFFIPFASVQSQEVLFPELTGSALLEALQQNYKPATVQTYSAARDSLFSKVYSTNDSLSCVYTGYTIYLDPTEDPTVFAYMGGAGINTEHTYPRAKGADVDPARADMHHLYPTRVDVNAARANFPFADIPDQATEKWYYLDQRRNTIPTSNINAYSESRNGSFEPPEAHKGNVARAMFYFYTIYRNQAVAADANFFNSQLQTLCKWHFQDPVDEEEWDRTWKIATYQDGKANPFVLDCTLAARLYCQNTEGTCLVNTPKIDNAIEGIRFGKPYPNPFRQAVKISFESTIPVEISWSLYNGQGQVIQLNSKERFTPGSNTIDIRPSDYPNLSSGIWWARLHIKVGGNSYQKWLKLLYQP